MDACCNVLPDGFVIFHNYRPFCLLISSEICSKRSILFVDLKFEIAIHFMLNFYILLKFVNMLQSLLRKQKKQEI